MIVYFTDFLKNKHRLRLIIGALCAANAIATFVPSVGAHEPVSHSYDIDQFVSNDITLEEMKSMIYSSNRLTDEEKEFFYNEDLFTDILPYINESEWMKVVYRAKFDNLDVKNIGSLMYHFVPYQGWYPGESSSSLFVKNYDISDDGVKDTLAHEYMHATQNLSSYPFFYEPAAELSAYEYYGGEIDSYKSTMKYLKVLMEIIGAEPIKQYVYTGDFSLIEERVKSNLSEDEYALFIECISEDLLGSRASERNEKLMTIYQSLYLNIYGTPMKNDQIISRILSDDENLTRSYFNERLENYYVTSSKKVEGGYEYHYLDPISEKENVFTAEHQL